MIKIEIENVVDKEQEYIDNTLDVVLKRINILKKSIAHLRGFAIDFDGVNFDSLKTVTRKIINKTETLTESENLYSIANYSNKVTNYLLSQNHLIDLSGINSLLNSLTENNSALLKSLLICKPENLYNLNREIINDNNTTSVIEIFIIKLAFNYDTYSDISVKIKSFFRDNNFAKYCPYCNHTEVEFRQTIGGQVGTSHQLDHFFDKATYPLLSYSMYNLVPSDVTCNATNKGMTKFTDDFHLNPYSGGFGNSINFIPIVIGSKIKVTEITIRINEIYATRKYNQLIGNNYEVNEDDADGNGNVNVFKLLTKYRDRTRKAEKILNNIQKTDKGFRAISKYLRLLNPTQKKESYLKWYCENIDTPFKYKEFNNEAYSKFNRDIHDYYYDTNQKIANHYIRELIDENSG